MNRDRVSGAIKQAEGALQQTLGKFTGDAKLKADGQINTQAGKLQNAMGGVKDAVRETSER